MLRRWRWRCCGAWVAEMLRLGGGGAAAPTWLSFASSKIALASRSMLTPSVTSHASPMTSIGGKPLGQ